MFTDMDDNETARLLSVYIAKLELPTDQLWLTTSRQRYQQWLGRRISASCGGAYCYLASRNVHAILINGPRIDARVNRSRELIIAEELIHMRDWLDGDRRRHAHHGYDRIAHRVALLTGATLTKVRSAVVAPKRRPYRLLYECPNCGLQTKRRIRGTWSCPRCAPRFDRRFLLEIVESF